MPPSLFVPDLTTINQANGGVRGGTLRLLPVDSKAEVKRSSVIGATGACQHQTKIVQPWLINGIFTDGYDAGQMYRL